MGNLFKIFGMSFPQGTQPSTRFPLLEAQHGAATKLDLGRIVAPILTRSTYHGNL